MDGCAIHEWVEKTHKSFIATAPGNISPQLVLDLYQCQMISLVVCAIQQICIEVEHIPGGCTSLCQPVKINTSPKANICKDFGGLDAGFGNKHFCDKTFHKIIECFVGNEGLLQHISGTCQ